MAVGGCSRGSKSNGGTGAASVLGVRRERLEGISHLVLAGESTFMNAAGIYLLSICLPKCWRDLNRKQSKAFGSNLTKAMPWLEVPGGSGLGWRVPSLGHAPSGTSAGCCFSWAVQTEVTSICSGRK